MCFEVPLLNVVIIVLLCGVVRIGPQHGGRTRSLIIGVSYDNPKRAGIRVLPGSHEDVTNMKKFIASQVSAFESVLIHLQAGFSAVRDTPTAGEISG